MGRFLIRRLLFTVFVLFIVSLITFVIFVKLPASDPARRATGRATTEANVEAAREAFGLNRPVYVQYARFAQGLIPWPGLFLNEEVYFSYTNFEPVKEEIFARLPVSATLALGAAVAWLLIGINRAIIWEMPFFGADFVLFRFAISLPMPILLGLVARLPLFDPLNPAIEPAGGDGKAP